jgi:neutral ceramidase
VSLRATDDMAIAGGIGPWYATGQDGQLRAVATVIQGPPAGTRVAILALDVIGMYRSQLDKVVTQIQQTTGIPTDHILVNCTHTHYAPATVSMHGCNPVPEFLEQVEHAAVEAVVAANRELSASPPVAMSFVMGRESTVGQNSRIEMRDGTISWLRFTESEQLRPTGPFDPDFPLMAFRAPDGTLTAAIFGHSTHSIGSRNRGRRSPAFYGLAAQEFERQSGAVTTFIEGAAGSTHLVRIRTAGQSTAGAEAETRVLDALRYYTAQAPELDVFRIASLKREVAVQVRDFDEVHEEQAVRSYCEKVNCTEVVGHDRTADVFRQQRMELAARRGEVRRTWLSAMRIGDVAIVGVPCELFAELGLDIKRRSPFRHTWIAELANDYVGYVADSNAYLLGGYQVWMGHHSWVKRGTGEFLVEEAVGLLRQLYSQ